MAGRRRQAFLFEEDQPSDKKQQSSGYKQAPISQVPFGRISDSPIGRRQNRPGSTTSSKEPLYSENLSVQQENPPDENMDRALVSLGPLPSRYPPLPNIGTNALQPQSSADQLLASAFPGGFGGKSIDPYAAGDRYNLLDTRLQTAEKTSRSLVDEFLRFQNDIRLVLDRHERFLSEERNIRAQGESVSHNTQDSLNQLLSRMQRAEDRLSENRDQIQSLSNHTRTMEATVQSTQKDTVTRKDFQVQRIAELKTQLEEMTVSRDRLESQMTSLQDEVRSLKFKHDSQSVDLGSIVGELKHKASQHDNDNRALLEVLKKTNQQTDVQDYQSVQLKTQLESRIGELRDIVMVVRQRVDAETADRRGSEQNFTAKLTDLAAAIVEQNRRREEVVRQFESSQTDKDRVLDQDRQRMQVRIGEIAEDVTKRILANELKVRDEMQSRFINLEKVLEAEHVDRTLKEKLIVEEADKKLDLIRRGHDEELKAIKEIIRSERSKYGASLLKLDEAINLVDKHLENTRKQVDKILAAEITARKNTFKELHDRINGLDHKLLNLQQSLQESIQGLSSQMEVLEQQLKYAQELAGESAEVANQALRAADSRPVPVVRKDSPKESRAKSPADERPDVYDRTTRTKIDMDAFKKSLTNQVNRQVRDSQDAMTRNLADLDRRVGQLGTKTTAMERDVRAGNENFTNLSRTVKKVDTELREKVDYEKDNRTEEVNNLKQMINEIAGLESKGGADVNVAVALADTEIKRLKDTLQSLKSQTNSKIGDEQAMRIGDVKNLQEEVGNLRTGLQKVSKDKLPATVLRPPVSDPSKDPGSKSAATSGRATTAGTTTDESETESTLTKPSAKTPVKPAAAPNKAKTESLRKKSPEKPRPLPPTKKQETETETGSDSSSDDESVTTASTPATAKPVANNTPAKSDHKPVAQPANKRAAASKPDEAPKRNNVTSVSSANSSTSTSSGVTITPQPNDKKKPAASKATTVTDTEDETEETDETDDTPPPPKKAGAKPTTTPAKKK